jgi:hypothetical protein
MSTAEILKTIVTPDGDGTFVELQISDGSPPREDGGTAIALALRVDTYELPLVSHLQIAVLETVIPLLTELKDRLKQPFDALGGQYDVRHPRRSKP